MDTVQILEDGKRITIPACELAPGYVRAIFAGEEDKGEVYVLQSSINEPTSPRWKPFGKHLHRELEPIRKIFVLVHEGARTSDEWEYRFRLDVHPWREIAIWSCMADMYVESQSLPWFNSSKAPFVFRLLIELVTNHKRSPYTMPRSVQAMISSDEAVELAEIYCKHSHKYPEREVHFRSFFESQIDDGAHRHEGGEK
jgi:hypothetical protein